MFQCLKTRVFFCYVQGLINTHKMSNDARKLACLYRMIGWNEWFIWIGIFGLKNNCLFQAVPYQEWHCCRCTCSWSRWTRWPRSSCTPGPIQLQRSNRWQLRWKRQTFHLCTSTQLTTAWKTKSWLTCRLSRWWSSEHHLGSRWLATYMPANQDLAPWRSKFLF